MPAEPRQPSSALQGLYTQTPDVSAFAVDAKVHPCDKAGTWVVGKDQMVLACAFNAMRAEVTKFEATLVALGDRDLEAWEVETIKEWWSFHVEHIRSYHATETSTLMPFLRRKADPGAAFVPNFAALEGVVALVAKILEPETGRDVPGGRATPTRTVASTPSSEATDTEAVAPPIVPPTTRLITRLASAVRGYRAVLYAYLAEKEKILVPTLRGFFTPEEVFAAFAAALRKTPRLAFGSLVHHLAGGEEAVKAFNARSVVSRSWRFGYGETVKHRSAYRAKVEASLERLLAGEADAKTKKRRGATEKTRLERVNALTPLELNERLFVAPSCSEALARAVADELVSTRSDVCAGADIAGRRTSQTEGRVADLAVGV